MLVELLEKAVSIGGTSVEVEYRDGKEYVTALRGNIGVGIACFGSEDAKSLLKEMDELRKVRRAILCGAPHRLSFSRYESFGEWVHEIRMKKVAEAATPKRPPRARSSRRGARE